MLSLKINNTILPVKIKIYKDWILLYENELSKYEFTKVDINSNNKIEIINDDKIIKEYILSPIIENYKELLHNMKSNNLHCRKKSQKSQF
jgi:hypothetical protein